MGPSKAPSLSPAASSQCHDDLIITPSRKVKALLAQFDDFDSDNESPRKTLSAKHPVAEIKHAYSDRFGSHLQPKGQSYSAEQNSDDEESSKAPRGRLAAQMLAANPASTESSSESSQIDSGAKAYTRIRHHIAEKSKSNHSLQGLTEHSSSGDELQGAALRRRLLKKKPHTPSQGNDAQQVAPNSSPLFFSSPSATKTIPKTPPKHNTLSSSDSDELPEDPLQQGGSKFLALVEKHRKIRVAREAAEQAKRAERLEQLNKVGSKSTATMSVALNGLSDDSDASDQDEGARLTQQARPTRKASKKAIEEMNRETQRMSRSMQLAHQARTKKRITKESLLARFNFTSGQSEQVQPAQNGPNSATASSAPASEVEGAKEESTPPTSPMPIDERDGRKLEVQGPPTVKSERFAAWQEEPPSMDHLSESLSKAFDKGKGKAVAVDEAVDAPGRSYDIANESRPRPIRVKWSKKDVVMARTGDSDSDLEIITANSKARKFAAFEWPHEQKSGEVGSHLMLRSLAQIHAGTSNKKHASMNVAEMESSLKRAARVQALLEKEEKLDKLRAKGVFIPTAEERMKEQQGLEDQVELERMNALEIRRREKEMAKKEGTYTKDQFDEDDSDDEDDIDFQDENGSEDQVSESDEEDEAGNDSGPESEAKDAVDSLKDDVADPDKGNSVNHKGDDMQPEEESDDSDKVSGSDVSEKENQSPKGPICSRRPIVVSDDDDDEEEEEEEEVKVNGINHNSPQPKAKTPQSVVRSARKVIPGLDMSDDLPIGLTQAFEATMADSGSQNDAVTRDQDSLAMTCDLPSPQLNAFPSLNRVDSLDIVRDSQPATQTQPLNLDFLLSSQRVPESPMEATSTQLSFMPTQDVGCVMSPFKDKRFDTPSRAPPSTVDTVILPREQQSPILQRKGRLRRGRAAADPDENSGDDQSGLVGLGVDESAFSVMQHAAKKARQKPIIDKSTSHAREAVDEAAEESEDEYAGLGGISDDDDGEEDEADRRMIDLDEKLGQGDGSKLAGFYADKERKRDEAEVSKLYKDITTGALRRKRGAANDLDLSDEEDANARRREAKRREFARMRRELLKDEAVGKIAEDRKKQAFLKSIEDRDDGYDEESDIDEEGVDQDSQWQSQTQPETAIPTDRAPAENPPQLKRPLEPSAANVINRPLPALRRRGIKSGPIHRKPSTLAEIREQVSFLIEEPDSQTLTPDILSSDDNAQEPEAYMNLDRHIQHGDEENEDADGGLADFIVDDERPPAFKKPELPSIMRAPAPERRTRKNVVDRLSLLRQASSSSSSSSTTHRSGSKLAFFYSSKSSTEPSATSFKLPSLLRRTTSNSSTFSSKSGSVMSATGVTERGAVEHEKEMIRKGTGGKRSAINYYAKGRVEEREKVRAGRVGKTSTVKKGGKGRGTRGFLGGLFSANSWE